MPDAARFLAAFLRHPTRVGAVWPSSRAVAAEMTRELDLEPGDSVVEFGPGTGPFTRALLDTLDDPTRYLGIERDPAFVSLLRQRYPTMTVVEGSAEHAHRLAAEHGHTRVRAILCGLPFASLPATVQDHVIHAIQAILPPGGEFRTFQYVHAYPLPSARRYRRRMTEVFGPMHARRLIVANIPPAFVLTWRVPS